MSTITLPNIRVGSDLQVRARLKDGGVAIDWSTLQNIKACIYSDAQRALAGRCAFSIDEEDNTLLVCTYAANKPQYLGVNRIVISAKYMGETKTYDKPAFAFVRWTADQEGEEITIDDPDVDVEIDVEDISSSILQEAVDAAFTAADRANDAAAAAEHMVDIHTGPEGKSAYEVAVEEGYTGTEEEWLASLKGDTGETPDISIGTVTTVAPGTPASASMTGTPEEPVLNLSIPQGVVGATPNFTVGTVTTGEPGSSVIVTITGTPEAPVLNLTIPQGMQGNTGSSVEFPYELVNNLTTNDATKGLSAAQGYVLDGKVSQLEAKVDENKEDANANFYGRKQNYTIGSINENSVFSVEAYHDRIVSDFIPVSPGDVVEWSAGDSGLFLCVYNESKNYISGQYWVSQTPSRTVTLSNASTAYIRITALSAYDSYVKVNDVVVWKKMDLSLPIFDNNLNGYTFEVFAKNAYYDWISGYVRDSDGGLTSSSANSCTSFIPVGKFKKVELVMSIVAATSNASVCFYDGNMNFISSYTSNMGAERSFEKKILNVPTNAKYIRASLYTQFLAEWFLVGFYEGDIIPVLEKVDGKSQDYGFGYLDQYAAVQSSSDDIVTGFIPVKQGDSVVWHNGYDSDSGTRALCAYDADKNMISGQYWGAGGTYFPERTISLSSASLSSVAFIRASMSAKYDSYISVNNEKVWRREDATPGIGVDDVFLVGSPKIKLTESLAESYTNISTKRVSDLYDAWDALVLAHPDYLSRGADLGNVTKDGNTFAIRQYTFGYNRKVLLDHEPTADETISDNQWLDVFERNKILVVSGMHGEEHTPTWGLMLAVGAILDSDEEWAKYIKDNATWKIIPCLNPTGWDLCIRECSTGAVLNRNEAADAPEAVMYMNWIGENKDAKILLDFHGTQGHYAYLPVNRGLPFHNTIYRLANTLGSAFRANWRTFYESVSEGYGTTYSPYIVAKYSTVWDIGHFACRMYDTYKMQSFAIETPDNLTDGLIGNNDLRMCKLTKDMAINIFQSIIPVKILQTN